MHENECESVVMKARDFPDNNVNARDLYGKFEQQVCCAIQNFLYIMAVSHKTALNCTYCRVISHGTCYEKCQCVACEIDWFVDLVVRYALLASL